MSLKKKVKEYLADVADEFDQEEVDEVSNIIETYDEDMKDLGLIDRFIINRLIDCEELSEELDKVTIRQGKANPFDLIDQDCGDNFPEPHMKK